MSNPESRTIVGKPRWNTNQAGVSGSGLPHQESTNLTRKREPSFRTLDADAIPETLKIKPDEIEP